MSDELSYVHRWSGGHPAMPTDFKWNGRPLVVIDPEDREQVERLLCGYAGWKNAPEELKEYPHFVADMQAALREFANPKPPKPEEPTGLGAVVEDAAGVRHVRVFGMARSAWLGYIEADGGERQRRWSDIDAVRVLSEGVQP